MHANKSEMTKTSEALDKKAQEKQKEAKKLVLQSRDCRVINHIDEGLSYQQAADQEKISKSRAWQVANKKQGYHGPV